MIDLFKPTLAAGVSAIFVAGCAVQVGPKQLAPARYHYNQAIANSLNEQLLLNLVRLRYRDTPLFLEISSVLAQYSVTGTGSLSPSIDFGGDDSLGLGAELEYTERPTITFTPLQGTDFVKSLLEPIAPTTLMLLSEAGWSLERLLACCVSSVGSFENARTAAGPTADFEPRFEEFRRVARALHAGQQSGRLRLTEVSADKQTRVALVVSAPTSDAERQQLAELTELLGSATSDSVERLQWLITDGVAEAGSGELSLEPRSLLGVLYLLSQGVDVPEADENAGKVVVTRDAAGNRLDWRRLTDGLLRVGWSPSRPADAFVAVAYRGVWFHLPDDDLDSKSTFNLLALLFALQASSTDSKTPLLTVSSGR